MEIPFFVTCGRGLDQFVIDEIYEKFPKALNVHSLGEGKVAFAIRAALVADNCKISENCSVPENKTFETDVTHHEAGSLESIAAVYRLKLVERIFYLIHCENVRDNYIDENNLRTIIGTKDLNSIASLVVSLKKQHISQEVSKNCCEPKSCQGTLNWKAKKDKIKNYMNSVTYNDKEMQNRVNESNLKRPNDLADCNNISPSKKICEMDSECCSKSSFSEVHENIYDEKPENISSSLIKPEDSYCDPKALVAVKNKESCQCILKLSNSKGICMCVREKASLPYDNQPKFQDQHKNYSLVTFRISSRISGKHKRLLSYSSVIAVFVKFMEDCKYGWVTEWINPTLDFYVNVTDSHFLIGVTLSKEPLSLRPYITHITLRSTISHLMAKLCKISSGGILLDPMCGGGTILVEAAKCFKVGLVIGGDMKREQLAVARCNLLGLGISFSLMLCQAINIPLKDCSINAVVCDFPFGKKHKLNEDEKTLLYGVLKECSRLLKADGRAVLLISEQQRNILVHFLTSNKSSVESNELNLNIEFVYPLSLGRTAALLAVLLKNVMCQECPCTFREADPLFPGANGTRWDCEYVDHGLTSVPKQCWSLQPDVTQVFLDYNEILELHPDDFTELTNLQTLTLRENQLGVIAKGIFSGLKELKYLDLANNLIMYPPSDLWNLRQLVYLDLSNNQLLDSSLFNISNLVNLQVLDLHLNQLTDIPSGSLVPLEGLLKFHIYWNQFVLLPDMSQNIFLEEVLVNGNALLTFPKYVFGPLLKPMTYHIVDNPAYDIWGTMLLALPDRSHIKMGNDVSVWVEDQSQSDELLAKDWLVQDGLSETIDLSTLIRICGEEKPQNDRIPPC